MSSLPPPPPPPPWAHPSPRPRSRPVARPAPTGGTAAAAAPPEPRAPLARAARRGDQRGAPRRAVRGRRRSLDRRPEPPRRVGPARRRPGRLRRGRARPRLRPPGVRRLPHRRGVHGGDHRGRGRCRRTRERADFDDYAGAAPRPRGGVGRARSLRGLQQRGRQRHARVLRPRRRAHPRARHRDDRGPRGHPRPRAHPRPPGPALRPRPPLRPGARRAAPPPRSAALAEGDALRVENAYIDDELTDEEQTDYDEEYAERAGRQRGRDQRRARRSSRPTFGAPVRPRPARSSRCCSTRTATTASTTPSSEPPDTEEHLFDPASFLAEEGPRHVELDLPDDADVLEDGPSARRTWYLFLAERIDPKVGLRGGPRLERRRVRGLRAGRRRSACRRCSPATPTRTRTRWRPPSTTGSAAMPGGEAEAIEVDGRPGIKACDPGESSTSSSPAGPRRRCTCRTCGATSSPTRATVLDPDGSRCYAAHRPRRPDLRGDHRPGGRGLRRATASSECSLAAKRFDSSPTAELTADRPCRQDGVTAARTPAEHPRSTTPSAPASPPSATASDPPT